MIRLHPTPDGSHTCPACGRALRPEGWHIVGMRNLAALACPGCGRQYYGDLPSGHGLYYPSVIEPATGTVHDAYGAPWFADWLARGLRQRSEHPLPLKIEGRAEGRQVLVLNCLDHLYGHALLKLLNVQFYLDARPDLPVLLLIQSRLRWLVPDGVAEVWTIDLPLESGLAWNDWLDRQLHTRLDTLEACWLAPAFAHPHPTMFEIERFSRVKPFPLDDWEALAAEAPTVTFAWREDRLWHRPDPRLPAPIERLRSRVRHAVGPRARVRAQARRVVQLADALRAALPRLDFAVAGLGTNPGRFPTWIGDLRASPPDMDRAIERAWCERYAASHVIIGVHGSNMLLPSAHAGSVVDLLPPDRWGNTLQDLVPRSADPREALFHYRTLPLATSVAEVAHVAASLIRDRASFVLHMGRDFCDPTRELAPSAFLKARRERLSYPPEVGP